MTYKGICLVILGTALVFSSIPSTVASSEPDRPFWTYKADMRYSNVLLENVTLAGNATWTYENQDRVLVEGTWYEVNVFNCRSQLSAHGISNGSAFTITYGEFGYGYGTTVNGASVMENTSSWDNTTVGTGPDQISSKHRYARIVTYSPPLSTAVTPNVDLGDSWNQTVDIVTTTYFDGEERGSPSDETVTFRFAVASENEEVVTDAGSFSTMKVSMADGRGNITVYWYSASALMNVRIDYYSGVESDPWLTYVLTGFGTWSSTRQLDSLVTAVFLVVTTAVCAFVVWMLRRKTREHRDVRLTESDESGAISGPSRFEYRHVAGTEVFCQHCGQQLPSHMAACPRCGRKLG